MINKFSKYKLILLIEEVLHQLIANLSHYLDTRFYTSRVVLDFFYQ